MNTSLLLHVLTPHNRTANVETRVQRAPLAEAMIVDGRNMSVARQRDAWLGILLILGSAVAWSTMGIFIRLVPAASVWTVVFWRSIFGGLSIIVLTMIERRRFSFNWSHTLTPAGFAITTLIASGIVSAVYSMQNTTIANACVIYSTVPFMAAILAWLWFRERPGSRTLLCTFVASAGVASTMGGTIPLGGFHLKGALAMVYGTFSIALMAVIMRRCRDTPMLEAVALAGFRAGSLASCFTTPFNSATSDMVVLAVFGIITQGGGLGIYTMGARRLPSAQAALLSSSEMPMSPLWVWIFFDEVPAKET